MNAVSEMSHGLKKCIHKSKQKEKHIVAEEKVELDRMEKIMVMTKDVEPQAINGNLVTLSWWNKGEKWIHRHAGLFEDVEKLLAEMAKAEA